MENELIAPQKPSFFAKPYIKYGIVGGIVASLFTYSFYAINEQLMMNRLLAYLPLLAIMIIATWAGVEKRNNNGGFLRYGDTVGAIFATIVVALLVNTILNMLLFLVIDPGLMTRMMEMIHGMMAKKVDSGEMTQKELDNYEMVVQKTGVMRLMLFQVIGGILLFTVGGLLLSLIIAIFVRKEPPVEKEFSHLN